MKLGWAVGMAVSAVVVALAWPAGAGRVALLLVTVAAGALALPALSGTRRRFIPADEPQAFHTAAVVRVPPDKPNQLVVLERSIDASFGSDAIITYSIRDQLRVNARRRLRDHHRLDIDDPADLHAVYQRVSPALWAIVAPLPRDASGRTRPAPAVPAMHLPALIAEIEHL